MARTTNPAVTIPSGTIQPGAVIDNTHINQIYDNAIVSQQTGWKALELRHIKWGHNGDVPVIGWAYVQGAGNIQDIFQEYTIRVPHWATHIDLHCKFRLALVDVAGNPDHEPKIKIEYSKGGQNQVLYAAKAKPYNISGTPYVSVGTNGQVEINITTSINTNLIPQAGNIDNAKMRLYVEWEKIVGSTYGTPDYNSPFAFDPAEYAGIKDLEVTFYRQL